MSPSLTTRQSSIEYLNMDGACDMFSFPPVHCSQVKPGFWMDSPSLCSRQMPLVALIRTGECTLFLIAQGVIEGHLAKWWWDPTAACTLPHHQALPNDASHVLGRSPLAVLVCTSTLNYEAQQWGPVHIWAPVGMEASQVVDAWPGGGWLSGRVWTPILPFDFATF